MYSVNKHTHAHTHTHTHTQTCTHTQTHTLMYIHMHTLRSTVLAIVAMETVVVVDKFYY